MKRHNFIMFITLLIFLTWCILNESFSVNYMFVGLVSSLIILIVAERYIADSKMPNISLPYFIGILKYVTRVIFVLYKSAFEIIKAILKRNFKVNIVTVTLPTDDEFVNALVCNTITLSPGTITIDKTGNKAQILTLNTNNKTKEELIEEIESNFKYLKVKTGSRKKFKMKIREDE